MNDWLAIAAVAIISFAWGFFFRMVFKLVKKPASETAINDFAVVISQLEGGKVQMSIAQIREVMKCINTQLNGGLYRLIKETPKK